MLKAEEAKLQSKDKYRNPFSNIKGHDLFPLGLYAVNSYLNKQDTIKDQQEFQRKFRNQFINTPITDYNYMYGPDSSGGTQYQNLIMAKNGANIRKGTSPDISAVEVEGGEFIQLPDFSTQHVEGPSHEQGGVHTNLPDGARVFSDFLKPIDSKKTYAQLAKKYDTEKYLKVLENPFAADPDRNTAKLMYDRNESILNELFEDQQKQNGNSNGTDQARMMAKFGLDLKEGESLSFTDPFEYGGVYVGDVAEFQDGGFPKDTSFYSNPTGYENTNEGFYDVMGKNYFQTGGQKTETKEVITEDPVQTVEELREKVLSNPELKQAFVDEYKKLFPKTPANAEELLDALEGVTTNIAAIRAKASQEELRAAELDKGIKNDKYKKLAKKYGITPIEDENMIKRFQGVYRTLATLQADKDFAPVLAEYELTPIGVDDTKWQGSLYSGKGISEVDGWFGNTTIGQLVRKKAPVAGPGDGDTVVETPQDTSGSKFGYESKYRPYPSTMGRFPLYQAMPEALGYMYANRPYSYYTPDFTHTEIAPPTLNIDPQLQAIDDSFQSAIRQNTGNASIGNSRNTAMFNQALQAKQQAFSNKQNYDANARFQADQYNAQARDQESYRDVTSAASIYNDYMAAAQDAAEQERLSAISSLTNKYGKFKQDELSKIFNVTNLMPNYYYDGTDPVNPLKVNPYMEDFYSKMVRQYQPTPQTQTTQKTQKTQKTQPTQQTPVVSGNKKSPVVNPQGNVNVVENYPFEEDLYPGLPSEDYLPDVFIQNKTSKKLGGKVRKK
jgi:hypothetical protein